MPKRTRTDEERNQLIECGEKVGYDEETDTTSDERYIDDIGEMNTRELLDEVLAYPEYLTDSYHGKFVMAIQSRGVELLRKVG